MDVALLVNPTSGKGRGAEVRAAVEERLRAGGAGVRTVVGTDAAHASELAHAAVAEGVDALVAVGGDGMVHLALQAIAGTGTPLGIVPAGTGNDLASSLSLPLDPVAAAALILAGSRRAVDAVRVGERWFGCVLGAGFDSVVNERANRLRWPRGGLRYDLAIAIELPRFRALPFRIVLDGVEERTDAMLVAVGNARSYGAGIRITPDAVLDDGLLDVCVLRPVSKVEFVRTLPKARTGAHVHHPAVTVRRARTVTLESPGVVAYADGERMGPLPLTCECVPGAVQVFAPVSS
ncbi:MAG TPA: diacylglycerol kinase [Mycobacteriales bacterium]|nr:diacylglycerol kinase [Mycobacteriales bacterium]